MKFLGNIIWLIFGGLATSIGYLTGSIALIISIIGIPFGLQTLKLAILALWPFGREVVTTSSPSGCLALFLNIIWLVCGGIWTCLAHLFFGLLLSVTIIGIPWGMQHFKLSGLALAPFGKDVVWEG